MKATTRSRSIVFGFAIVIILGLVGIFVGSKSGSKIKAWNVYEGAVPPYHVTIEEEYLSNGKITRLVHLHLIKGYEVSTLDPFAISGHDYNGDEQFDRVLIRMHVNVYYSSVAFTSNGRRVWEPWPQDEGKIQPFSDTQVNSALGHLNLAMATVHNQNHLITTLESFRAW